MLKVVGWIVGGIAALALIVYVAFQVSPWPGALLIRSSFDKGAAEATAEMAKYVPDGIASVTNVNYDPGDSSAYLDVYFPADIENTERALPTIVWVHGGGWVSGRREDVANYIKILASHGYTTVTVDYTIAPEAQYPTPVRQVNAALGYLKEHAAELHVDASRFVLAGDSAGGQIASQMANIITSPAYAEVVGVVPTIEPERLAAALLFCGAYDYGAINLEGGFGGFLKTVLWSYSGTKDFKDDAYFLTGSVYDHITPSFPRSFITAGNADPLGPQSVAFAEALKAKGVFVETLFYPADFTPALGHEYQFHLDLPAAQDALEKVLTFLATEVPRD